MFKQKGDVYIDGSTDLLNKVDVTAGVATTGNFGAYIGYAGAQVRNGAGYSGADVIRFKGNMLNLGVGYFLNHRSSPRFRFELYGDLGLGNFNNTYTYGGGVNKSGSFFNGNYQRTGVLTNIGYNSYSDKLYAGYSLRASNLKFMNPNISDSSNWTRDIERFNSKSSYNLLEHSLMCRYGSSKVKFQLQLSFYQALNTVEFDNAIEPLKFSMLFGVVFSPNISNE
ncbi:MAG: hypothetical protein R2852_01620 [Bacteroidia bacterium]